MNRQSEADFLEWVGSSRDGLRRTAFLLCGDWHLSDDLVQESLTRLYVVWARVSRTGDPGPYCRKILVNLFLDHRRRPSRREVPHAEPRELVTRPADRTPVVEPRSDGQRELLVEALRQVPRGQRAVLVLRYWEDLSVEQTADLLEMSAGTVRSQSSRGLDALRRALACRSTSAEESR